MVESDVSFEEVVVESYVRFEEVVEEVLVHLKGQGEAPIL